MRHFLIKNDSEKPFVSNSFKETFFQKFFLLTVSDLQTLQFFGGNFWKKISILRRYENIKSRSSRLKKFFKIVVFKKLVNFTEKHAALESLF